MHEEETAAGRVTPRLEALERFGFPLDRMRQFLDEHPGGELKRLAWLEARRDTASDIEDRIVALSGTSFSSVDALEAFRDRLNDPFSIEEVMPEFERAVREVAPWEPVLHRSKKTWFARNMGDTWGALYQRLAALDPSSQGAVHAFQHLFEQPERYDEVFRHLETVETDERRQRAMVEQSADALRREGYDLGQLNGRSLLDVLDHVETWQAFHDERQRLMLAVRQWIAPFDEDLAEEWRQRCSELQHLEQREKLDGLSEELHALAHALETRRKELSDRIDGWRHDGIVFPHAGELQPQDLMEWEANHDAVEASIQHHLSLVERWKRFNRCWPSRTAASQPLVGHLEHTEALQQAVDELDALWKKAELDSLDVLQAYEDAGMEVSGWRQRVFEDPINALERLSASRPHWEKRASLIERLRELDVSFSGAEDVEVRLMIVTAEDPEPVVLEEVEGFVHRFERRQERHRAMLEEELSGFRREGVPFVEATTATMSLSELERYLGAIQRQRATGVDPDSKHLTPAMMEGLRNEIDALERQGWSVSAWKRDLERRPLDVAQALSVARPRIQHHDALRRRVRRLPWGNDIELATRVELQLRDPSCLEVVANSIPQWARHLAQRPVEQADFTLAVWEPMPARPTLLPVPESLERPVLQPTTALDDAHEAMLEAMDGTEPEPLVSTADSLEVTAASPSTEVTEALSEETPVSPSSEVVEGVLEVPPAEPEPPETMNAVMTRANPSPLPETVEHKPALPPAKDEVAPLVEENTTTLMSEPKAEHGTLKGTSEALTSLTQLLALLGMDHLATSVSNHGLSAMNEVRRGMAQHVNVEPRDVRIGRLLRLTLRLLPEGDTRDADRGAMLRSLAEVVPPLKRWTRRRLEARHSGAEGDFLADAKRLGTALKRIPGLGRHVPLSNDVWPLAHDLETLQHEVNRLVSAAALPSAGGVQA